MDLLFHNANDQAIAQRGSDGYISATNLCKAAGKKWNNYYQNDSTALYLEALAVDLGLDVIVKNPVTTIPATALVQVFQGGNATQGTWIHHEVAVDLAKWLSPQFRILVNRWVVQWMSGKAQPHSQQPEPEPEPKKLPWKPLELFPSMSEQVFKSLDPISRQHFAETSAERTIRIQKERTEEMLWVNHYQYKQYFQK